MVGKIDLEGLTTLIREEFRFLDDHGFEYDSTWPGVVRWRREDQFITVAHDWRDGFTEVSFSRGADRSWNEHFSLRQAVESLDASAWPKHGWQATSDAVVGRYVAELAGVLAAHGDALLTPDSPAWAHAAELAQKRNHAYTVEVVSRPFLARAEEAWRYKNWPAVIAAYEAAIDAGASLRPSEARRLDYARAHGELAP